MSKTETLLEIKTALAEKYAHLAKLTSSKPRREKLNRESLKYRRQAENLRIKQSQENAS